MVSWKYESKEVASTSATTKASVCHSTTLSQNQNLELYSKQVGLWHDCILHIHCLTDCFWQ